MPELTRTADKILVPVLPSDIDIHACSRCMQNLLLVAKVQRDDNRLGIIANRVRRNTLIYQSLTRFLGTLGHPDRRDAARFAELRARGRAGTGAGGDEAVSGRRGSGGVAAAARLAGAAVPAQQRAGGRQRDSERRGGNGVAVNGARSRAWRRRHAAPEAPVLQPSGLRVLG